MGEAGNFKVLVVEDYEDTRLMLRWALEARGYRVVEAADGGEAVEVAWRECPNIILMDLSLPVLDGLSATRKIREDAQMSDVPVVALTAHQEASYRTNALAAGCSAYLTKPVDFDRLDDLIRNLLAPAEP